MANQDDTQPKFNLFQIYSVDQLKTGSWYLCLHKGQPSMLFRLEGIPDFYRGYFSMKVWRPDYTEADFISVTDQGIAPYQDNSWNTTRYTVEVKDPELLEVLSNRPKTYKNTTAYVNFVKMIQKFENPDIVYPK